MATTVHVETLEQTFRGIEPREWRLDVPAADYAALKPTEMKATLAWVISVSGVWTWTGSSSQLVAPRVGLDLAQRFGNLTASNNQFRIMASNMSTGSVRSDGYNRYLPGVELSRTFTFSASTAWTARSSATIIKHPSRVAGELIPFPRLSFRATSAIPPGSFETVMTEIVGNVTLDVEWRKA